VTYSRRYPHQPPPAWCTSSPRPRVVSLVPHKRRHCSGRSWHVGENHLSSRRRSLHAASNRFCKLKLGLQSHYKLRSEAIKTHISPVLQTNGCEPSSGHNSLLLKARVWSITNLVNELRNEENNDNTYVPLDFVHHLRYHHGMAFWAATSWPNIIGT